MDVGLKGKKLNYFRVVTCVSDGGDGGRAKAVVNRASSTRGKTLAVQCSDG